LVSHTRRPLDTRRIRRLNVPEEFGVEADAEGVPKRICLRGAWQDVTLARRPWRIDQNWWRESQIRREYFRVAPQEGPPLTIYHDLVSDQWARQEY
jgi:hypothetical protein